MPNPNTECLNQIALIPNGVLNPPDLVKIKNWIKNYGDFYVTRHKVPKAEIFYAAAVKVSRLMEVCQGNENVKIYLAKYSDDNNDLEDFKFVIMGANEEGKTLIDDDQMQFINKGYLDQICCKNPPPNASDRSDI